MSNKKWALCFLFTPVLVLILSLFSGGGEAVFKFIWLLYLAAYIILMILYYRQNEFKLKNAAGFTLAYIFGATLLTMVVFWLFIGLIAL